MIINTTRTAKNLLYLCLIQFVNYLGPLIVMPHLLRNLGVDNVGVINISLSIATLVIVICSYGYNFTGVKFVANRNKEEISRYLSTSFIIRWIWLSLTCIVMLILSNVSEYMASILVNAFPLLGMVVASLILPVWFFQGLEKLKYVAILNAISKILFASLIVLFISESNDTDKVLYIYSFSSFITIIYVLYYLTKNKYLRFRLITLSDICTHLSSGRSIYLQQVLSAMMMPAMFLIMDVRLSDYDIGLITISDRIVGIPIMLMTVINQSFYTQIIKYFQQSKEKYIKRAFELMLLMLLGSLIFYGVMSFYRVEIINYFFNESNERIFSIINVMFVGVIFAASGQFFTQVFVTLGIERYLARITFLNAIMIFVALPVVIDEFGFIGGGYFIVTRQVFVYLTCFMLISFIRYKEYAH